MQTAGARPLREDEQQIPRTGGGLSLVEPEDREAVLLQWERKIEQEERRSRFAREEEEAATAVEAAGESDPPDVARPRFPRRPASPPTPAEQPPSVAAPATAPERRTITISGRPDPLPRRRQSVAVRHIAAQPDRLALWAFLLGLFLLAVAFGTAHA